MTCVLHLGLDVGVSVAKVIMILDACLTARGNPCKDLVDLARSRGALLDICEPGTSPESIIVTDERVILSPLTTSTLSRRVLSLGRRG